MNKTQHTNLYESVYEASKYTRVSVDKVIPMRKRPIPLPDQRKFYRNTLKINAERAPVFSNRLNLIGRHKRANSNLDFPKPMLDISSSSSNLQVRSHNSSPVKAVTPQYSNTCDSSPISFISQSSHSRTQSGSSFTLSPGFPSLDTHDFSHIFTNIRSLKNETKMTRKIIKGNFDNIKDEYEICEKLCESKPKMSTQLKKLRINTF